MCTLLFALLRASALTELMIMGVISLGVFLTLELGDVDTSVAFYAFEFAHIVVFFAALIFVMQVNAWLPDSSAFSLGSIRVSRNTLKPLYIDGL